MVSPRHAKLNETACTDLSAKVEDQESKVYDRWLTADR